MTITVTVSSDVTDVWQYDLVTLTLILDRKIENKSNKNKNKLSSPLLTLTALVLSNIRELNGVLIIK